MKKIGRLMEELGFKENAPDSVKEAFIKHLIKASTGTNVITPTEKKAVEKSLNTTLLKQPEQLSFEFINDEPSLLSRKKAVS